MAVVTVHTMCCLNLVVLLWLALLPAGSSVILMQLPALQDIAALRGLTAVTGDLQLWLLPK